MSFFNITNRYAKALFKQAEETNSLESIGNDMQMIFETLESSKELKVALESPVINNAKKKNILNELFGTRISKESANFLNFVIEKNREDLLYEISKRFLELKDDKLNIMPASVTSAIELSNEEKNMFEKHLEEYLQKKVRLSFEVDTSIIGGFVVQLKDKMLDASITHQLQVLRKRLVKADQSLVN